MPLSSVIGELFLSFDNNIPLFFFLIFLYELVTLCVSIFHCLFVCLFLYLWLSWVFVSVQGLSPAAASGGHSSLRCTGLSPSRPPLLWSTGSRRAGSVIVAHGPSFSAACGILPDQGSNPCPCISRQIPNHCATREAPIHLIFDVLCSFTLLLSYLT